MDRGSKFYEPTGETTEWEDILVKKGILAPKTKVQEEEEESEDEQDDPREEATLDELDEMEVRSRTACYYQGASINPSSTDYAGVGGSHILTNWRYCVMACLVNQQDDYDDDSELLRIRYVTFTTPLQSSKRGLRLTHSMFYIFTESVASPRCAR